MVETAINEPGGGDYAKAANAIRTSARPPAVKQFQLGQIIVGANMERARIRPPESLEQGLRMMEDSTLAPGEKDQGAVQQLRFLFERGDGTSPMLSPPIRRSPPAGWRWRSGAATIPPDASPCAGPDCRR